MHRGIRLLTICAAGLAIAFAVVAFLTRSSPSQARGTTHSTEMQDPGSAELYADWVTGSEILLSESFTVYIPLADRDLCLFLGLLWNPDLETDFCYLEAYQEWDGISGFVAPYWRPFVNVDGGLTHPEFNSIDRDYRRYSGEHAQQYGDSAWGDFEAGIYQVVTGTQVSDTLKFTIYGLGWIRWKLDSSYDERVSDYTEPGGLSMRVGIDPYGGDSYTSTHIVWSDFADPYDVWTQLEVTATAEYTRVSVWAHAKPATKTGTRFKQIFWDHADLTVLGAP